MAQDAIEATMKLLTDGGIAEDDGSIGERQEKNMSEVLEDE